MHSEVTAGVIAFVVVVVFVGIRHINRRNEFDTLRDTVRKIIFGQK